MLGERVLRVTVKPFMDMNTMIEERLTQCCVHVATTDGTGRPPVRAVLRGAGVGAAVAQPDLHRAGLPLVDAPMSDPRQVPTAPRGRCGSLAPASAEAPYDPLRLCVFATVALLAWLLGPVALVVLRACSAPSATSGRGGRDCCARGACSATPAW